MVNPFAPPKEERTISLEVAYEISQVITILTAAGVVFPYLRYFYLRSDFNEEKKNLSFMQRALKKYNF